MASSDADVVQRVQRAVAEALDRQRVLNARRRIVVAVSGGVDSLCLLDALVATLPWTERRLIVGHVDHQLRPDSGSDTEHVRAIAAGYGLRCALLRVDVTALAAAERRGVEEAARVGRYRALRDAYPGSGTPVVATGHTRDDVVETVLLHILRGSGRAGLGGISEDEVLDDGALGQPRMPGPPRVLRVVRPLIGVGRADTVAYCEARRIRWLTDETNVDPRFTRNRVRAHLLPVLRTYNPAIDVSVTRMARVLLDEDAWLDDVARRRCRRIARDVDGGRGLSLDGWRRQPVPMRRRIVRLIANAAGFDEIGFEAVERALAVGSDDGPPRAQLGGGLSIERRADTLIFNIDARVRDD
jgi:tRNA(Ile)-lysidine synthetase-like protein